MAKQGFKPRESVPQPVLLTAMHVTPSVPVDAIFVQKNVVNITMFISLEFLIEKSSCISEKRSLSGFKDYIDFLNFNPFNQIAL